MDAIALLLPATVSLVAYIPTFARIWGPVFRLARDIAVTAAAIHWY